MAQVTLFHYMHKDTVLHRMDGRIKLVCMLALSLSASFALVWQHYLIPLSVVILALVAAKLPITALLRDMVFFGVLILVVVIANAISIPGHPIPGFPITGVSLPGLIIGLRFAGRLTIIVLVCAVITGTTPITTFRNAVEWFLRPIPLVPQARIATMINLTFILIPIIMDSFSEMMEAQKSRCIELQKNPVKRINYIVFPLLGQTLRRADEIASAMESRCYSEQRNQPAFKSAKADWFILTICLSTLLFVLT